MSKEETFTVRGLMPKYVMEMVKRAVLAFSLLLCLEKVIFIWGSIVWDNGLRLINENINNRIAGCITENV